MVAKWIEALSEFDLMLSINNARSTGMEMHCPGAQT